MLAMLCFAGMDAISKWLVADYADRPDDVGPLRRLLPVRLVRRAPPRPARRRCARRRPWLQVGRSLLAVVESAVFVLAFRYLPLADTHAVAATSPLIVIALGVLFLGERAGLARWLAVAAGFVGMLLIVRPGFRAFDWPLLLPLVGAVLWAGYQILIRALRRAPIRPTRRWSGRPSWPSVATTLVGPWQWQWPDAHGLGPADRHRRCSARSRTTR